MSATNFIVIDISTTGIPKHAIGTDIPSYKNKDSFNNCRVVQVAWIVTDNESNKYITKNFYIKQSDDVLNRKYSIKYNAKKSIFANPDENNIYCKSTIKKSIVKKSINGVSIKEALTSLHNDLVKWKPTCIVVHNEMYVFQSLFHELYREDSNNILLKKLKVDDFFDEDKQPYTLFDTASEFSFYFDTDKFVSLEQISEKYLTKEILNLDDDALIDTEIIYKSFINAMSK